MNETFNAILCAVLFMLSGFMAGYSLGPVKQYWEQYENAEMLALRLADCKAELQLGLR